VPDSRINEIKRCLNRHNLSHILISDLIDIEYISGFKASNVTLLISSRRHIIFTDFRYRDVAQKFCRKNTLWQFVEIKGKDYSFLKVFIKGRKRVGIQANVLTIEEYDNLKKRLKGVKLVKLGADISDISIIKKKSEIRLLQRAAAIGDKSFNALIQLIKQGMTEKNVADILLGLCKENGSEKPSFDPIVLFGSNSALPHGMPSKRKLKSGDWILFDFGCTVQGFGSDITRTVVFGTASKRQKEVYSIVKAALGNACTAVRPGVKAGTIDRCARSVIEDAGYGDAFGHATGHGVGLRRVHENPRINKDNERVLEKGMVFTIEPGIYLPRFGGVRIEDMVVVTEKGSRALTKATRDLLEI
jgi:Xaa-Pro aminopeptidase